MTKTFRRRGLGVGPQGGIRPAFGGATWGQTVSPIAPQPIQVSPSTTATQTNPGYRSWRGQNGQNQNQNLQWGKASRMAGAAANRARKPRKPPCRRFMPPSRKRFPRAL